MTNLTDWKEIEKTRKYVRSASSHVRRASYMLREGDQQLLQYEAEKLFGEIIDAALLLVEVVDLEATMYEYWERDAKEIARRLKNRRLIPHLENEHKGQTPDETAASLATAARLKGN